MIESYIPQLENAGRGKKGELIAEIGRLHGWSKDKVYRELKKAGYTPGRSRRKDAGSTHVDEEALTLLAAFMKSGVRKNGKATACVPLARAALESNGVHFGVSNGRLCELLRERGMDIKSQKQDTTFTRMRSLYPNHVHQVDPSVCLVYYLPGGGQKIIRDDEVYKNKPYLKGKEDLKVWRYVLTDHYSASVCARYYQVAGEGAVTLWDFLLYAWGKKEDPYYLFHGVPEILTWDRGSANTSQEIANAAKGLRIQTIAHTPGNPRAKGQVENGNNLIETLFESRLKAEPCMNVEELNKAVEGWCSAYNAGVIENYDSTLRRAKTTRLNLWQTIPFDKLKELPEDTRSLFVKNPVTRKVGGDLRISYIHPRLKEPRPYVVGGLPGIRPGILVEVQPILMDAGGVIRVSYTWQGEEFSEEILPVELDEAGFPLEAPVWGENFKTNKETYVEKAGKLLDEKIGDGRRPFEWWNNGEGLKTVSTIRKEETNIIPAARTGERVKPPEAPEVILSTVEAAKELKNRLEHWENRYFEILRVNFPKGVPDSALDSLEEILTGMGGDDAAGKESAG